MKMKIKYCPFFATAILPAIVFCQQKAKPFTLTIKTVNVEGIEKIYMGQTVNGVYQKDNATEKNGVYKFHGSVKDYKTVILFPKYIAAPGDSIKEKRTTGFAMIYVEPGNISAVCNGEFSNISVKGSKMQNEYARLQDLMKPYLEKRNPLREEYNNMKVGIDNAEDKEKFERNEREQDAINKEMRTNVLIPYIESHSSSPIAFNAFYEAIPSVEYQAELAESIFNKLSPLLQRSEGGKAIKAQIDLAKKVGVGRPALDFSMPDTSGNIVVMSSFRGKYLLIDFWGSWCRPCRAENPNLVKLYQHYRGKGFEILSVASDSRKQDWLKAIHHDNLQWSQVSDLKGGDNTAAKLYGVVAVPQNFLISPDGIILARNLMGEELEKKLAEIFKSSN